MNSRERVFRTLEHREADRIPVDFWASKGAIAGLERHLGRSYAQLLDDWDVDFRYIAGPRYIGPPLAPDRDIWGVRRTHVQAPTAHGTETYEEVAESPLAAAQTVEEIERYPGWPSPDHFDYSGIEVQCDAVRAQERVVVFMGDRLNRIAQLKPAMYLRGVAAILEDMALWPEGVRAILGEIRAFYRDYLERILTAAKGKIDIVLTGDDFGSQNAPLVSPAMWDELLRPGFSEYLALIRQSGARSMHHTCGAVSPLVPRMIACGLDVLQSVQPEASDMALERLIAQYGRRLCFQGGISIQQTLPFGSPEDVRAAVRRIAAMTKGRGGYIFCTAHNIQADTPIPNILALLAAYREFGTTGS